MKYFREFFEHLEFYKNLKEPKTEIKEGLWVYLKSPSHQTYQREIDKWLKFAKEHDLWERYQKQFQQKKFNFYEIKSKLNELMVGYFLEAKYGLRMVEYEPSGNNSQKGDWLVETVDKNSIFIEIKSPWEKRRAGAYSHYKKLLEAIKNGYCHLPRQRCQTIIIISDELNISPVNFDDELIQVLYGKQAICFKVGPNGPLEEPHVEIVDRRSVFQRKMRRSLGAVAVVNFNVYFDPPIKNGKIVWAKANKGKYLFKIYHNPFALEKVKISREVFKGWPQFILNDRSSRMEWINNN